jgi:hypothetical protein
MGGQCAGWALVFLPIHGVAALCAGAEKDSDDDSDAAFQGSDK